MNANPANSPGILGRGVRLAAGVLLLSLCIMTLMAPRAWISDTMPQSLGMWFGAMLSFYALRGVPDKGLLRSWGRWPQFVVLSLALLAVGYNLVRLESWWGPPLGVLIFVLILYVTSHLGLSFVLAGILGHPG